MEAAIRFAADPGGVYKQSTIDTAGLVKNIRKRHRDTLEEMRRNQNTARIEKEDLQHNFDDEKERLYKIINGQNEAMRLRSEQDQPVRDEFCQLQTDYNDLLAEKEAKDSRIKELEEEVKVARAQSQRVVRGSVEASRRASREMDYQATRMRIEHRQGMKYEVGRIEKKHKREMADLRGWNTTIQDRLNIARRLQPVYIFHRAEVGTVCEMHEKMNQMKKANEADLAAKENKVKELQSRNGYQERQILSLEIAAERDKEALAQESTSLTTTREALQEAESKAGSYELEVTRLNKWGKGWESRYKSSSDEIITLKIDISALRATQRDDLIQAQNENKRLQITIDCLQAGNATMSQELESLENNHRHSLMVSQLKNNCAAPGIEVESLSKALKAANDRADALQIEASTIKAENSVLREQRGNTTGANDAQAEEQLRRLQGDNRRLSRAAEEAEDFKSQLMLQFASDSKKIDEQLADRTRELQRGFELGFESLRELRDKWFLQKRSLEESHNRQMVAANHQWEVERQSQEEKFMAIWKDKEEKLRLKEEGLQHQEAGLAAQETNIHSSGQDLVVMKTRAERAEREVQRLQTEAIGNKSIRDSKEQDLEDEISSQSQNVQRHMALLNEAVSKIPDEPRLHELYNDLCDANLSMKFFQIRMLDDGINSETLREILYGADLYCSDVHLLDFLGRPVLLAQLQNAKNKLDELKNFLAESPNVDTKKALSILRAPRGDENVAKKAEAEVVLNDFDDPEPSNPHKRSEAPLVDSTYDDHGKNAAETSMQQRILKRPKARRTGEPTKSVPQEHIDPAIWDQ